MFYGSSLENKGIFPTKTTEKLRYVINIMIPERRTLQVCAKLHYIDRFVVSIHYHCICTLSFIPQ